MTNWNDWVANKITRDPDKRETISATLSGFAFGLMITLILFMMVARSCDVCYEMRIMNLTAELNKCYSMLHGTGQYNITGVLN